jgi:hypothetical protein
MNRQNCIDRVSTLGLDPSNMSARIVKVAMTRLRDPSEGHGMYDSKNEIVKVPRSDERDPQLPPDPHTAEIKRQSTAARLAELGLAVRGRSPGDGLRLCRIGN